MCNTKWSTTQSAFGDFFFFIILFLFSLSLSLSLHCTFRINGNIHWLCVDHPSWICNIKYILHAHSTSNEILYSGTTSTTSKLICYPFVSFFFPVVVVVGDFSFFFLLFAILILSTDRLVYFICRGFTFTFGRWCCCVCVFFFQFTFRPCTKRQCD